MIAKSEATCKLLLQLQIFNTAPPTTEPISIIVAYSKIEKQKAFSQFWSLAWRL